MNAHMHPCLYVCVRACVHVYGCAHVCVYVCPCLCMCICLCMCVCVCVCVCVRVCPPPLRPLINSGMSWYDMVSTVIDLTNSVFQLWSVPFVAIDVVLELKCSIYRAILVRVS